MRERIVSRLWIAVATWFVVISLMRLSVYAATGTPGDDGMLYRTATLAWLAGQDPWAVPDAGAIYAAPPPTLLAMIPLAILPENLARVLLLGLGLAASAWMIRRLRLAWWWMAFPPLVDGLWIGNPHVFVAPLLVAGAGPLAALVKLYALAVPAILLQWRTLVVSGVLVLVTAPLLPWALFVSRWPEVSDVLRSQSGGGGFSVWVTPLLIPVALVAAVLVGRKRFAWWSIPVFWPFTQWYYSSMAMPVLTPLAAMALAVPVPGATTAALALAAGEIWWRRRNRSGPDMLPEQPDPEPMLSSRR